MKGREWLHAVIVTIVIIAFGASVRSAYYLGAVCIIFAIVVLSLVLARLFVPNGEE